MTESLLPPGHTFAGPGRTGARASLDRVLDAVQRLGLKHRTLNPNELMVQCPVHQDIEPSLHVTWRNSSTGGLVLLHCQACKTAASGEDLAVGLGLTLADLYDEPLPDRSRHARQQMRSPGRRRAGSRRGKPGRLPAPIVQRPAAPDPAPHQWVEVEVYTYTDREGQPSQRVARQECTSCTARHKNFPQQFRTASGGWAKKAPAGFRRVLYQLPQVAAAVAAGQIIWLLEGEKDVHAGERAGLVATTNPQGASDLSEELLEDLAGATVHVVLDRDEAGWARGVKAHQLLTGKGCAVRLFLPAPTAAKSDFSDHVDAGHAVGDLIEVSRAEVATWDTVTEVRCKAADVQRAIDEAEAQLAAAVDDAGDAEQHRRHARRWALESELRFERADQLGNEAAARALEAGSQWAAEALEEVRRRLSTLSTEVAHIHQACGLPVPASITTAGTEPPDQDPAVDRAGADRFDSVPLAASPTFRVIDNAIMQWEPPRGRRGSDGEEEEGGSLKLVLGLAVRVVAREFVETDEEDLDVDAPVLMGREDSLDQAVLNPPPPRRLSGFVLQFVHPDSGEVVHQRVTTEQWKDHSWLDSLPGPPDYDHRKSGLDNVQRAVLAVSGGIEDAVRYRSTGWRRDGDRHMYVHARGVITADGHRSAATALSGPLRRYNLPDPTRCPRTLRAAFVEHSATLLDRIPARVAAPLLGQVFRSVLGHNPWVLTLVGPPGSYKTSVAAKAMHHLGEAWDHSRPSSSMSGNGDTLNAMRLKLHNTKDALYWMDDFAPTKRWVDAQKLLEEMARLIHNREERNRANRDGQELHDGTGPRASGLATSEVMPRPGSGAERMLVVPIAREDIDTDRLFPLDEPESRYGRALLMASFIRWLAEDLPGRRERYLTCVRQHTEVLKAGGEAERAAAALANARVGWLAMTDFLGEAGAVSAEETQLLLGRIDSALDDTSRAATDPDLPTRTGARVRALLAYALSAGVAHVDDVRTGEQPEWPTARRLGWQRTALDADVTGAATKFRSERQGHRLGWVLLDPDDGGEPALLCEPEALEPVLKTAAGQMADGMQIDRNTATRALADEGILVRDLSEPGKTRFTITRTIFCERRKQRVIALRLRELLGDEPDDGHDGTGAGPAGPDTPAADVPAPVADLFRPGPANGTAPGDPQADPETAGAVLESQPPAQGETTPMPSDHSPTLVQLVDADGVTAWAVRDLEIGPCLICGEPSITCFDDDRRMHSRCFTTTTAAERDAAAARQTTQHAAPVPAAAPGQPDRPPSPAPDGAPPPARRPAGSPRSGASEPFRAAAAVLDVDHIACGDGSLVPLSGPLRHIGDVARLVDGLRLGTQVTKYWTASGQIWLTAAALASLGVDPAPVQAADPGKRDEVLHDLTRGHPMVADALADGWTIGGRHSDSLGRWTRLRRADSRLPAWVAILPALDPGPLANPMLADDPDPTTLAGRLQLFARTVGFPYQLHNSTTGLDLMMALRGKDRERLFAPFEPVEPAQLANTEIDISWCRPPTSEEAGHRYVHAYDRGGSYLAGASVDLGVGPPTHHDKGRPFDPKLPGYWLVEVPPTTNWRMPHLLDPVGNREGRLTWVTTPALQFAVEQDLDLPVAEAYTWPEKLRVLDPWYARMRDARSALDTADPEHQVVRDQVKIVYAATIGMMGSEAHLRGRPGYAPDRRHHIVAKARTNILRRIHQIGRDTDRWPVAVVADTIVYTSDEADPVAAWPGDPKQLGRGLGEYKPEGTAQLADHLEFLTGGRYRGKEHLTADGNAAGSGGE